MNNVLHLESVSKRYTTHTAVDHISLSVGAGEFYGLLGPNGAGKTTTITMVSGILPPDTGVIHVSGLPVYGASSVVRRHMGIVPQEIALYDELSAFDNLVFWGSLYGVTGHAAHQRARQLLEWVGLSDRMRHAVKTYSGGMKRRVNIAASLMHDPALIIMDEPTVGIDPQSRNKIYELLEDLHAQGKSILYTTHYMEEAERMCDRIGIIDKGRIIAEGSLDALTHTHAQDEQVVIHYSGVLPALSGNYRAAVDTELHTITFTIPHARRALPEIVQYMQGLDVEIMHIDVHHAGLETIFLHLTGRHLRD